METGRNGLQWLPKRGERHCFSRFRVVGVRTISYAGSPHAGAALRWRQDAAPRCGFAVKAR